MVRLEIRIRVWREDITVLVGRRVVLGQGASSAARPPAIVNRVIVSKL